MPTRIVPGCSSARLKNRPGCEAVHKTASARRSSIAPKGDREGVRDPEIIDLQIWQISAVVCGIMVYAWDRFKPRPASKNRQYDRREALLVELPRLYGDERGSRVCVPCRPAKKQEGGASA